MPRRFRVAVRRAASHSDHDEKSVLKYELTMSSACKASQPWLKSALTIRTTSFGMRLAMIRRWFWYAASGERRVWVYKLVRRG